MKKDEAIDFLEKCRWWFEPYTSEEEKWNDALDMAIEALTHEIHTETHGVCSDLISRQDAENEICEVIMKEFDVPPTRAYEVSEKVLEALPSAEKTETVQCKDCKHYQNDHICQYFSRFGTIETNPDDYCSFGDTGEAR